MKIREASQAYSAQLKALWNEKRALTKAIKEQEKSAETAANVDRVELSRELEIVDAKYQATKEVMEKISMTEMMIHNAEVAKQQGEAMADYAEDMMKIMEVYRRISAGEKVPPEDEKKLMEYDHELYMAAKNLASMKERSEKEHDSLWEDEEVPEETKLASEIAGDTEIDVPSPERVASDAAASVEAAAAPPPEA